MPTVTLPPRTQTPCCYRAAMERDATFCGECGKPIVRCMAAEECGGLLDDHGLCTVCVTPHIEVEAGAKVSARVGGALAVPLSITNKSVIGRPLFVTGVWSREAGGEWRAQDVGWERLAGGEARPMTITADRLTRAGAHSLEVLIALASRWRWRQECFAFQTTLRLTVDEEKSGAGPVVNIGGETAGHGNVVYITGQDQSADSGTASDQATALVLVRAEKEERRLGLRGLDENTWVPKTARFIWRGFAEGEAPSDGPLLTPDGLFAVGRSRTRQKGGLGDVRLLVREADQSVDEAASQLLSRRHVELYVECDRLMLRVNSDGGVRINGDAFGPDKTVALKDGDTLSPLVKHPDLLKLTFRFQTEHYAVRTVVVTRQAKSS